MRVLVFWGKRKQEKKADTNKWDESTQAHAENQTETELIANQDCYSNEHTKLHQREREEASTRLRPLRVNNKEEKESHTRRRDFTR